MGGFGPEVGDELRELGDAPAEETDDAECEGELAGGGADAVVEVAVDPADAGLLLLGTGRVLRHLVHRHR